MAIRFDTVASRSKLKPKRDPYFQRVATGLSVGYRKMAAGAPGTWLLRLRDDDGVYHHKAIGALDNLPDFERYDHASKEAQKWADHVKAGGVAEPKTIADVCAAYVSHLLTSTRKKKSDEARKKSSADAERRFKQYVTNDKKFATLELSKLTPAAIQSWRNRLASRPIQRGSGRGNNPSKPTNRTRSASSLNRDMTPFRAALNHAYKSGWVTTDFAWRTALEPIENADNRRDVYLDREQRKRLIEACASSGLDTFVRVLSQLPVRPGALAQLCVRDFDSRLGQLSIRLDKTGARQITLPAQTAAIFTEACKNKLPAAPIFTQPNGKAWDKDAWKDPFKAAALASGLPADAVMYSLRHSAITDLSEIGLPLLTIAQISGTSVKMIEKHYGQLQAHAATAALAALAM
jgi:integrase